MIDPQFWKGRRVFLTGNTGFKGSWLSLWLQELGAEVTGFALPPPTMPSLFELAQVASSQTWVEGDTRDRSAVLAAMMQADPEVVFHLAAQPLVRESYLDPVGTYATNVMGTVHVLEAVRSCPSVRAVVNVTTDKCYENKEWVWGYREDEPMGGFDPYSNSKGCSELVTSAYRRSFFSPAEHGRKHHVGLATARAGNVIGGGDFAKDRLIPDILRAIRAGERVLIRSPHAIRPWQHVLEPLCGYLTLAQALVLRGPEFGEAWNFGPEDSDAKSVQWIVEHLCAKAPEAVGFLIDESPQPHEAHYLKLDISKAKARLHWTPRWSLDHALERIVEWSSYRPEDSGVACRGQIRAYQGVAVGGR